jgi:MFS family permease
MSDTNIKPGSQRSTPASLAAAEPPTVSVEDEYGARPDCFKSTTQEVFFVLTCTMAIGVSAMTTGSITVISSFVGKSLNMTTAEITWLSAATSLAGGSFLLFFARVADLFGRRVLFIGSMFLFSVLALGAGFCNKPVQLDVLCGLIGLMSAGAVPPAQGMLGRIYHTPSRRKNAAFACFGAGNPLGFVLGMISSGIASQLFSWRASFWFLALVYFVFTILAVFTIPKMEEEKQPLNWETVKGFDVLGVLLTIAGTSMFSAALSLGSDAPEGWKTTYVIALLVIGIVLMFAFVGWEMWYSTPLVNMSIFKDKDFSLVSASSQSLSPTMSANDV